MSDTKTMAVVIVAATKVSSWLVKRVERTITIYGSEVLSHGSGQT